MVPHGQTLIHALPAIFAEGRLGWLSEVPTELLVFYGLTLAAFLGALFSLLWDLFLRDQVRVRQRISQEFNQSLQERARKAQLFKELRQLAPDKPFLSRVNPTLRQRFERLLEQSDVKVTPRRLLTNMIALGLGVAVLGLAFGAHVLVALLCGLASGYAPLLYIQYKRKARLAKLLEQLPEVLELMARFLAAGQNLSRAMQTVAKEFEPPIANEIDYCYEQQNLGLPAEVALRGLADRTGLLEYKILVLALLVQQQTGGNLVHLLEKLAQVVRGRLKLQGQLKALTAEGRMQAGLLIVLPPFMFGVMLLVNRHYAMTLLDYPRVLGATVLSMVIGALWIRRIVNVEF